jgi:hypothetical protein
VAAVIQARQKKTTKKSDSLCARVIDWYGGALVSRLNDKQKGSYCGHAALA